MSVNLFFQAVMLIDLQYSLPLHFFQSALFTYRQWQLIGFDHVTEAVMLRSAVSMVTLAAMLVFMVHTMRYSIAAKQDSDDASAKMLGFKHVLRGVCDGDLMLHRESCSIVDDAGDSGATFCTMLCLKSSGQLPFLLFTYSTMLVLYLFCLVAHLKKQNNP